VVTTPEGLEAGLIFAKESPGRVGRASAAGRVVATESFATGVFVGIEVPEGFDVVEGV
jgi:hypothetical protein